MMDLDEAIQHCEEVADTPCFTDEEAKCYSEHRQLAEWLKELKAYREQSGDAISRKYILDLIDTKGANLDDDLLIVEQWIQDAPSVNPHPIECGDAISRQAVEKITLEEPSYTDALNVFTEVRDKIRELPSVTPQQRTGRWIPVSERLPEERGDYLVTQKATFSDYVYRSIAGYALNLHDVDEYDFADKKRAGWYEYDSEWGYHEIDGVIAWMPLPKPYKAESEEEG